VERIEELTEELNDTIKIAREQGHEITVGLAHFAGQMLDPPGDSITISCTGRVFTGIRLRVDSADPRLFDPTD
jgi:hypothetical protein